MRLLKEQAPGLAKGLMFPSKVGTFRAPNSLDIAWAKCLAEAQIDKRFTTTACASDLQLGNKSDVS